MDLQAEVQTYKARLASATFSLIAEQKSFLSALAAQLRYLSPARLIQSERQRVDELTRRAFMSIAYRVNLQKNHLAGTQKRLEALSPLAVLARGYAVVTRKDDGGVVFRVAQARDVMKIRVSDGEFEVKKT